MRSIASRVAPCLAAAAIGLAANASAHNAPARPDPLNAKAEVPALVYRSAFQGYRPNVEGELGSWSELNQTAHQIGGWRAYAKESRQADDAAAPRAAASAASAPVKPATQPPGHAHH